jgi:MYXO-CTERM domain-containing protein
MKTQTHYLRRRLAASVCGVMGIGAAVLSSSAQVVLTDGNSLVNINPNTQSGVYDWFVDGQDYLAQQWLWYRVGTASAEASVDTLNFLGVTPTGTKQAMLSYSGLGFNVQITYSLLGGTAGSGVSDLAEQIKIINTTAAPLDFHLFLYSDFDLAGNAANDTVTSVNWAPVPFSAPGYSSVTQVDGLDLQQTTFGTFANRAEATTFPVTLNHLNDGAPSTLANAGASFGPVGPGDMTYAFQWDLTIAANSSKTIGVDKRLDIVPIPEPSPLSLALLGLAGLGAITLMSRRHA